MFKYRLLCTDKDESILDIRQIVLHDLPCGKSIVGGELYSSGIHFREYNTVVKGFYLSESENELRRGSPLRVVFSGRLVEAENQCFFDVWIYPRIAEVAFLAVVFAFLSVFGKVPGFIVSVLLVLVLGKGYADAMKGARDRLERLFCRRN